MASDFADPVDSTVVTAEGVVPCADLAATLAFFTDRLDFRVDSIRPADDPRVAIVSRPGLRLRLERIGPDAVATAPAPAFVVSRASEQPWRDGRAGMRYRDLIPGRAGGRMIGSHISIDAGGAVADWVHFHRIDWQWIYCRAGWVTVLYEDQGPALTLRAGDCVLQPPEIRHRVLECSPGLEVIEFAAPADHETVADHALALPTSHPRPERDFAGQRFVHHRAEAAAWTQDADGFESRELGLAAASTGRVRARVLRPGPARAAGATPREHGFDLHAFVVLAGSVVLSTSAHGAPRLGPGDAALVPRGERFAFAERSPDLELLEVTSPAE